MALDVRKSGKVQYGNHPLTRYASDHSLRLHPTQEKLKEITMKHSSSVMLGSADELQLLGNICKAIGAKKTLDIELMAGFPFIRPHLLEYYLGSGVFTGYSALAIALVLPPDGKVIACDINDDYAKIGKPFWKEAEVDGKIDLRIAPATETLQSLIDDGQSGTFDFAFIDADKENYLNYYELCYQLLRPGGLIAIDNVLWFGRVADPEFQDTCTVAIRELNERVAKDERVDVSMLTIGDGTTLAFKR